MRLWHEKLIPILPNAQLLGQHRECAALRGNGWGKKHSTVDYVFTHDPLLLFEYHRKVMSEMVRRGFKVDPLWQRFQYRGKNCMEYATPYYGPLWNYPIYPEHNESYLQECLDNLRSKRIVIEVATKLSE